MATCQQMENLQLQVIAAATAPSSSSASCIQDYKYSCQCYYDNQQQQQQQELEDEEVLPVVRFEDHFYLRNLNNDHGSSSSRAVVECSVCLGEFRSEDEVSQLRRCGHVFHLRCIKSWLDRNRFTCPLCRSVFLDAVQFYRSKYSSASSHHHVDHHSVDHTVLLNHSLLLMSSD